MSTYTQYHKEYYKQHRQEINERRRRKRLERKIVSKSPQPRPVVLKDHMESVSRIEDRPNKRVPDSETLARLRKHLILALEELDRINEGREHED